MNIEIIKAFMEYMEASLCVDGQFTVRADPAVQEPEKMIPTSGSGTSRIPFVRPESKKPPISDREALEILCAALNIMNTLKWNNPIRQREMDALELAIQALEDRIIREDDLK